MPSLLSPSIRASFGTSCFNTSGMSDIALSTLSIVPITCLMHLANMSSILVPSLMHKRILSPSARSSSDFMALFGPWVPIFAMLPRWSLISPEVFLRSNDFSFDLSQRWIDLITPSKHSERSSFALARPPQMAPSFFEAISNREIIHSMSSLTCSAKTLMRPDRRKHLQALEAAFRILPSVLMDLKSSTLNSRKDPETVSTSSAKFWIEANISFDSSPFLRSPSKAALPRSTTVKKLTFSTSSTRPFRSVMDLWKFSGSFGSPFL
mmetsp:Transcript_17611/g.19637  ORF Transcript_17611/g.19637 Transcript_17611/m.19637 type:complete len:265 (+) Transcript_17611:771-1565(+)